MSSNVRFLGTLRWKDTLDVEVKLANLAEVLRDDLSPEVRDRATLEGQKECSQA